MAKATGKKTRTPRDKVEGAMKSLRALGFADFYKLCERLNSEEPKLAEALGAELAAADEEPEGASID